MMFTPPRERQGERGVALVVSLLAIVVMTAVGTALILAAATESRIASNFRTNAEALYAAEAALERVVDELRGIADWNLVLDGTVRSSFVDGDPRGRRWLADARAIDLGAIVNDINCRKASDCSGTEMDVVTAERPWGANNPRWQPFAWGYLNSLLPSATTDSPFYVVALVADDAAECDDNPLVDGGAMVSCPPGMEANPGAGVLGIRAEAFGPFGAHRAIELTVARAVHAQDAADVMPGEATAENNGNTAGYAAGAGLAGLHILSWREVR